MRTPWHERGSGGVSLKTILYVVAAAIAIIFCVSLVFWWLWAAPIKAPSRADRDRINTRAVEYLRAWKENDRDRMMALESPLQRWDKQHVPAYPGGEIALAGYWRPPTLMGKAVLLVQLGRVVEERWPRWRRGRVAFLLYTRADTTYLLTWIRDDGEWMVTTPPGVEMKELEPPKEDAVPVR